MDRLPQFGEWHLSNNLFSADPPFAVLQMDFRTMTGTARYLQNTTPLTRIAQLAPDKFGAAYQIATTRGLLEAVYNDDQTLTITFIGPVSTTCTARPVRLVGGERPVAQWSTSEKIQASIERALPRLPANVRQEIASMLTPQALAIMSAVLVLWGVSHFFGVGEIVDVIVLITGGALLGWVAVEVGEHLGSFAAFAVRAQSEADLDKAAEHFAHAVSKGGVQVVFAVLMWRGGRPVARQAGRPARPGELPPELNAVPVAKIPPASRTPAASRIAQGLAEIQVLLRRVRADPRVNTKRGWSCDDAAEILHKELKTGRVEPVSVGEHVVYVYPAKGPNPAYLDATAVQFTSRNHHPLPAGVKSRVDWSAVVNAGLDTCVETGVFTLDQYNRFVRLIQSWKG